MRIRIRETGAVVFSDEFRRINSNTSLPADLTQDVLDAIGADEVHEGQQPTLSESQYSRYDGVENVEGTWFTIYTAVDYSEDELATRLDKWRQSASCTPFQGRIALSDAGFLSAVEAAVAAGDEKTRVAWEYALIWERMSPMIARLASALSMTDAQIDDLFKAAAQVSA